MAYGDDYVERRGGLSLGGKIAIALAALIGLPIIAAFAYGVYSTVLVSPETKLARAIDNSPEAKGFYAGLKRNYPQEYAALNAAVLPLVERGNATDGVMMILRKANDFQHSHSAEVASAPDDQLAAILSGQIKVLGIAVTKPEMCKRSLSGVPGRLPALSADESRKMEANQFSFVAGAAAGRDHPVKRPGIYPSDQQAIIGQLRGRGIAVDELKGLDQPGTNEAASIRKCTVALELLKAVAALPKAQSLRIFAQFVRAS